MLSDLEHLEITKSTMGPNGPLGVATFSGFSLRSEPIESLSKFEALAFAIHEGIPGHFFQILFLERSFYWKLLIDI